MKLIIDISNKTYEIIKNMVYFYNSQRSGRGETKEIFTAIKQGIPLEEELEKIKAEIMSIGNWREHYEMPIAYLSCLTIVEHHISELKGESNAE